MNQKDKTSSKTIKEIQFLVNELVENVQELLTRKKCTEILISF